MFESLSSYFILTSYSLNFNNLLVSSQIGTQIVEKSLKVLNYLKNIYLEGCIILRNILLKYFLQKIISCGQKI